MTTIVYDHKNKTIAWDSRKTGGNGTIKSDVSEKMTEANGVKFWIAGNCCDDDLMISHYFGNKEELIPESNCFAFDDGKLYRCGVNNQAVFWKEPLTNNDAFGSGGEWAMAALDFKLSAVDAVEYAKTKDCYTGGEVKSFCLEGGNRNEKDSPNKI